jgi:predicted permease
MPLAGAVRIFGIDVLARADAPVLQTVGRPRPGVSLASLDARVRTLSTNGARDGWTLTAHPAEYLRFWPAYRSALARFLGIFAALGLCLLIVACSNIAGLALTRSSERQRELAIRQALGAPHSHLLRRLVAENLIVVIIGGAAGLVAAAWTAPFAERIPTPVPVTAGVTLDWRLMAIGAIIATLALVLFTLLSLAGALSVSLRSLLASSSGAVTPAPTMQRVLATAQVAICATLLTAAMLIGQSAFNVDRVDVGFDAANRVTGLVALRDQAYTPEGALGFYQRLQTALEARPDVEAAAVEWNAVASPVRSYSQLTLPGQAPLSVRYNVVGPHYFAALGIALRAGREFGTTDDRTGDLVAIINETLAARFTESPIGQTVTLENNGSSRRVIGVVRDVTYNGITEPPQPFIYLPLAQAFRSDLYVHVHVRGGVAPGLLRDTVRTLDPRVAVVDERMLASRLDDARAAPRASAAISAAGAAMAVGLALIGLYSVLTSSVERRARELAIRAALGAGPAELIRIVAAEGAAVTAVGLVLGMAGSAGAGRIVSNLLFGVSASDPTIMVTVTFVVVASAAAASFWPARRVALSDPAGVLKA